MCKVSIAHKVMSNIRQTGFTVLTCFRVCKSLTGHAKVSIIPSYLQIIKCHSAIKCRQDSHTNT